MDRHRNDQAEQQVFSRAEAPRSRHDHSVLIKVLFQCAGVAADEPLAVEIAHHDRESAVSGYGGDHAQHTGEQSAREYIHDVLRRGKAQ